MSQPAELAETLVPDAGLLEAAGQLVFTELRVVARLGDAAHVDEGADAVRAQDGDKLVDRVRRVPDREDGGHVRQATRVFGDERSGLKYVYGESRW